MLKDREITLPVWAQIGLVIALVMGAQLIWTIALTMLLSVILGIMSAANPQSDYWFTQALPTWMNLLTMGSPKLVTAVVALYGYTLVSKETYRKTGFISIKQGWRELAWGLVGGVVMISLMLGILLMMGEYRFVSVRPSMAIVWGFLLFVAVALGEEILVRGVFQRLIARRYGMGWAILIPSFLFAAMHLFNPSIAVLPIINIFLAGVMFGVITYKTSNLWAAIGLHTTWNFTMGNIYGIEVSGIDLGQGFIHTQLVQETMMNGGAFGLEGGYLCTLLLILVIGAVLLFVKQKKLSN